MSLTYDDGHANNLDNAIPDLEAAGFRGTFYLTVGREVVCERASEWRAAFQRGHEIGNHSVNHPGRADAYPERPQWLAHALEEYTAEDIAVEVSGPADWLDREIGPDPERSYCYPCFHTAIGSPPDQESYLKAVRARHPYARTGGFVNSAYEPGAGVNDPWTLNPLLINGVGVHPSSRQAFFDAFAYVAENGGWLVLVFHGIGGPSHPVERSDHQALINHLAAGSFWVAPFKEVAAFIDNNRQ